MRDGAIHAMHQAAGRRQGLILAQMEFLKTRLQAMEDTQRLATFGQRLRFLWDPRAYWRAVDNVQQMLLAQARKAMEKAAQKIEVVPAGVGDAIKTAGKEMARG